MANIRQQILEARKEGYSDDEITSFLSSSDQRIGQAVAEGYNLDEIANFVAPPTKAEAAKEAFKPELLTPENISSVGRQVGLTGRYAIEGIGGLADLLATPFRAAVNVVAPEGVKAAPLAPQIADALGLPKPETATERVVGKAATGLASAATGMGAAQAVRPVSQMGQMLRQLFTAAPTTQLTSAAASGAGSQFAAEMGLGETGQTIAGMAAGLTPAVAPAMATRTRAALPPQTRQIIGEASGAGYTLPPSQTNPSLTNKVVESLSGKIKTNQTAALKNQEVTNELAKKSLGIPKDQPLTQETLITIRANAGRAYDDLSSIGNVTTGKKYLDKLDDIVAPYVKAAEGFPEAKASPVIAEIQSLKTQSFDAASGIAKIRQLRESADTAYASGDKALGKAYKEAASAIEDALEAQAKKISAFLPPDLLKNFRESRKLIAKTYSVQRALNEASGNVVAANLAAQLKRGAPLEGELRTIARTAQAFPKAVQSADQIAQSLPLSPLDIGTAALGFGVTGGNPLAAAGLIARPLARTTILSRPYQATLGRPGGVFASQVSRPEELALGGLLGTQYGLTR